MKLDFVNLIPYISDTQYFWYQIFLIPDIFDTQYILYPIYLIWYLIFLIPIFLIPHISDTPYFRNPIFLIPNIYYTRYLWKPIYLIPNISDISDIWIYSLFLTGPLLCRERHFFTSPGYEYFVCVLIHLLLWLLP